MSRTEKTLMLVSAIGWLLAVLATVMSVKERIQDDGVVRFPPQEVIERISPSCPSGMVVDVDGKKGVRIEGSHVTGVVIRNNTFSMSSDAEYAIGLNSIDERWPPQPWERLDDEVHVYPLGGEPWRSLEQEVRHGD